MHHFLQTSPRFCQLCQPAPGSPCGASGPLDAAPSAGGSSGLVGAAPGGREPAAAMTWDSALPAPPRTFPSARGCVHGCCRAAHGRKHTDLRVLAAAPLGQPMAGRGGLLAATRSSNIYVCHLYTCVWGVKNQLVFIKSGNKINAVITKIQAFLLCLLCSEWSSSGRNAARPSRSLRGAPGPPPSAQVGPALPMPKEQAAPREAGNCAELEGQDPEDPNLPEEREGSSMGPGR